MKTISTIKTAFTGVPIALLACLLTFSWSTAEAGGACENSTQWPTSTQTISGLDPIQLTTCAYAGDYTVVDGITAGRTYEFTSSDATTYITVREDVVGGTVLAAGTGPISVVSGTGGNLYVHYNTDVACGTATTCLTITVQDVTPPCENTNQWPTSAYDVSSGSGVQTIDGCVFAGDFSELTGFTAGNYYQIAVAGGNYLTVREGAVDGPVVAAGVGVVALTSTGADLFVHYNTEAVTCGTASICLASTVEDQGIPPCENTSAYGTATASAIDGESVNIVGFAYVGSEYSTINGIQEGYQYQITHAAGSYITVRSGATDGPVLASGFSPLDFSGGVDATIYAHYTVDASCTQDASGSHSVDLLSVGFPPCENSSQWPTSAVTVGAAGAGAIDIATDQYSSGEYSVLTGIASSTEYEIVHAETTPVFITVRTGAVDGPVLASGFSPLTIATATTDDLYIHWNETQGCDVDETGSFLTTIENLGVQCVVDAGTITADEATLCLENGSATITATPNGDQVVPTGWAVLYAITDASDPSLPLVDAQSTPSFTVTAAGDYLVHTLVYDPADIGVLGQETTGVGMAGLLLQNGGGPYCGALDVTGSPVSVVICPDNDDCDNAEPIACGDAIAGSTVNGSADASVTSAGIGVWYTFEGNGQDVTFSTCGAADFDTEITVQTGADCNSLSTVVSNDDFTGCAGATSELTLYTEFGTTYYIHVGHYLNGSTTTGDFTLTATCVCPDASALSAGTLTANSDVACLDDNGEAVLSATQGDAPNVPAGYESLYVLTSGGMDYVIEQTNAVEPTFTVTSPGVYTLHTLVYSSTTLDLSGVVPGTTTAADVLAIVTAEDSICAALDVTGATVTVTGAGSATAVNSQVCVGEMIEATVSDTVVPAGYTVAYVLTDADNNNTILDVASSPMFGAGSAGSFTVHTLVYNTADIPDLTLLLSIEAGGANASLVQGGGSICASLDLTGATVTVDVCTGIQENLQANFEVYPNPSNGQFVVEISGVEADVQLNVLDLAGRVVYTEAAILNGSFRKELNIDAATGTYLMQVVTPEGIVTRKLMID